MALNVCSPPCILDAMDTLWFHQTILFFSSSLPRQSLTANSPSSLSDEPQLQHQQQARNDGHESSTSLPSQQDGGEEVEEEVRNIMIPTRVSPVTIGRGRSHSSSPSTKKRRRRRLGNRTTSSSSSNSSRDREQKQGMQPCMIFERSRSSRELEMEEVKGFMDLGFRFKAESLSPRMMSVVPGLQRLGGGIVINNDVITEDNDNDDEGVIIRPYLSEAWLIRRASNSPLLNVRRIPGAAAPEMRRHIRFWARTVATVVQQESY
ncbi:hypothetical protein LINGRAHAP2_LOCUS35556 [Linum grandiflorum]